MKKNEAKITGLKMIYAFATMLCEGVVDDKFIDFSDNLREDVYGGKFTESEAKKIQMEIYWESIRLARKIARLRQTINKQNDPKGQTPCISK